MLHRPVTVKFKRGVQGLRMEANSFFDDPPAPPWEGQTAFDGPCGHEGERVSILSAKAERNEEYIL